MPSHENPHSVLLEVTRGGQKNSYLRITPHQDFFPPEVFGSKSEEGGLGKRVRLLVDGLVEPVDTDIASDKMIFRKRGWCHEFFEMHGLRAGELVVLEKISEYSYKLMPKKKAA